MADNDKYAVEEGKFPRLDQLDITWTPPPGVNTIEIRHVGPGGSWSGAIHRDSANGWNGEDTYTCNRGHVNPISTRICPHCEQHAEEKFRRIFHGVDLGVPFDPRTRDDRLFAWFGTAMQLAGAMQIASHHFPILWAYGFMLVGSLTWSAVAAVRRDKPLLFLNLVFSAINLVGILMWQPS